MYRTHGGSFNLNRLCKEFKYLNILKNLKNLNILFKLNNLQRDWSIYEMS